MQMKEIVDEFGDIVVVTEEQVKSAPSGEAVVVGTRRWSAVKNTCRGELVRIGKSVYVRDDYIREEKRYMLTRWDDTSRSRLVKGSKLVEVGFTF